MKVFIVGGTGLLGSQAAAELIRRGHEVVAVALPPIPTGAVLPPEMRVEFGNYLDMTDDALRALLTGCEGFVFAAGVDERVEGAPPIEALYRKYNIDPLRRLLALAKEVGVRHAVVLGSYFSHFDKQWPQMELSRWHPYIKGRREQEAVALSFAGDGFDVAVLELPYIFGTQPGRRPVWVLLVKMLLRMWPVTFYTRGGTTMVTVRQVGQAVAGALERNRGGLCYPIGDTNWTWRQLLGVMNRYLGYPNRRIVTVPDWTFALTGRVIMLWKKAKGQQSGLHAARYAKVQCANLFIDKALGCDPLGVEPDDIDAAIGDSVRLCLDVIHRRVRTVGMKGE